MENYIKTASFDDSDVKLFQYLYLLSYEYAAQRKFKLDSRQLESFAIQCACRCFDLLKISPKSFPELFAEVNYDIRMDLFVDKESKIDESDFLFKNHIIDLLQYSKFNGYADISKFTAYIDSFMKHVPKKRYSSEWDNLYISVLYSFYSTLCKLKTHVFDYLKEYDVNVILYNTDELYRPYVKTLVSELLCNLRDSFDKTLSVKSETVYTVHLKELLNNEEC